jgi:hypothetical protein
MRREKNQRSEPDFVAMACTSASVSYRNILTRDELMRALASGHMPKNRLAHFCTLFEEGAPPLIQGLVKQAGESLGRARVQQTITKLAAKFGVAERVRRILRRNR